MTHRFYTGTIKTKEGQFELRQEVWVQDGGLANQALRVLRMRSGDTLVFFDGKGTERLYKIDAIEERAFHAVLVTDIEPKYPRRKVNLAFSLLKKDKNEWVIQKATELGVTRILPLLTDRTEKTGFDIDRADKIAIEASEQCGRHSLPIINEPQKLESVLGEYRHAFPMCVADMDGVAFEDSSREEILVFVGPEGGWSDRERGLFNEYAIPRINMGDFTLRAETACIAAVQLLT